MPDLSTTGLSIQKVRSADHLLQNGTRGHTYRSGSNSSDDDVPLSMRFMHKPSRATEELRKASDDTLDVTRRNSLRNAFRSPSGDDLSHPASSGLPLNANGNYPEKGKLVRKKSGEIVKPLLKESFLTANNRSRSLPSTPTYKLVHFGGDNDVRYFKMKDKPAAILASNSPTLFPEDDDASLPDFDDYSSTDDGDYDRGLARFSLNNPSMSSYFDYYDDELNSRVDTPKPKGKRADVTHYPKPEWDLQLVDFPLLSYHANIVLRSMPVFVERIFLSVDSKYLLGQTAVRNLAYEKKVTVRYTLDNWATIVEIPCVYVSDVPPVLKAHNYDRFVFKIPLDTFFNGFSSGSTSIPEDQVCQLCVKFCTPVSEYWDNNDDKNYLFHLHKISRQSNTSTPPPKKTELPPTAKTKQEAHIKKPKYSLSYLKKMNSNTTALGSASPAPVVPEEVVLAPDEILPEQQPTAVPGNCNDFELNNYYLSSPLFSSWNSKDAEDLLKGQQKVPIRNGASGGTTAPSSFTPIRDFSEDSVSPDEDAPISPVASPRDSKEALKHMSYKELLESYCFFTTPQDENSSKTTLVLSDDPGSNYQENFSATKPVDTADSSAVFTVSSFLKN
ncbi:hypothetical protein PUMCH_001199 [Australozyma saopauloensis]|uniref:CBM21 domain-containing protein n=1 Tax=Australozyma saopauloensis TaxID=291208 RepID=A0AAX4H6R8_9ASCO|nr:hypothetical protein PUMCH_001199 [[Candida] saopauloensis]